MNKKFTHFNQDGEAHMVSIKDKEDTNRIAIASGSITMSVETIKMITTETKYLIKRDLNSAK